MAFGYEFVKSAKLLTMNTGLSFLKTYDELLRPLIACTGYWFIPDSLVYPPALKCAWRIIRFPASPAHRSGRVVHHRGHT